MKYRRLYLDSPSLPKREPGNAGFDIPAYGDYTVYSRSFGIISTGLAFEIPDGWVGLLYGRSGLRFKSLVDGFGTGVIDSNYRGELKVLIHNQLVTNEPLVIRSGNRIAQMVVVPYYEDEAEEATELSDTNRGDKGFGSTGVQDLLWAK